MKRRVMITVDVEAQPTRAPENHINQLIYGRFGNADEYGLGRLFDIAERHNVRMTCFLDYAEEHLYGDALLQVGRYIRSRGHDLQAHLHPEFMAQACFDGARLRRQNDMFKIAQEQARFLVDYVTDAHYRISSTAPIAFRGGGYRYNGALLAELARRGFKFNSSYNPSRENQPFNIGPLKQFKWADRIIELPISCVPNFRGTKRLYDYNFNSDLLLRGTVEEIIEAHTRFLEEFFKYHGDDAIAVMVMHSWSLLNFNQIPGFYDSPNLEAVEKFDALLSMMTDRYELVTTEDLSKSDLVSCDRVVRYRYNKFVMHDTSNNDDVSVVCDVCGASEKDLVDYNGPRRKCGVCGSLERQRTLASMLKSNLLPGGLSGKNILLISPSDSERRLFAGIENIQVTTLEIRPELKPDIVADICNMPHVHSGTFDLIFASHVLVHVYNLQSVLSELSRVLVDGGLFVSYEPCTADALTAELNDFEQITQHYGKELFDKYKIGRYRNFSELDLDRLFEMYFERAKYVVCDKPTGDQVIWNIWSKVVAYKNKTVPHSLSDKPWICDAAFDFSVDACPICGDALQDVDSGQNCKGCESRARLRSMAPLMREYLAPRMQDNRAIELPLLAFAMTGAEREFLSTVFKSIKSVSLFGNYSTDHESGVDMRDLSRYAPDGFSGVFGSLLFDYFSEHEQALRECYRVMAPGGVFFTHIAPYRLVDGDMPPQQKGAIKSRAGYFEYLPDKTELPDVKVGREWFRSAMERVGFKTALVRVRDAVPGLVSEWFVGFKPGVLTKPKDESLPVSNLLVRAPSNIDTKISEVFRSIVPLGTAGQGVLTFDLIEAQRGSLVFLEDCYLPASNGGGRIREVVATNGSRNQILVSRDLGKNWQTLYENVKWDDKIRWAFTLADGSRLIRTFSGRMYHLGVAGELVSEYSTGAWHWHGSQGIGQSASGTVMYAEYAPFCDADGVQDLSVWRYRPWAPHDGWHRVLTLPAAVRPPQGELRHFHVCHPHPANPGLWILASGDIGAHCRLWLSRDDGGHWQEVVLDQAELVDMPEGKYPRLLRFTQFSALDNGDLIWGTDDTGDVKRAALIRLRLNSEHPTFHFLGWLGNNCIRNIAKFGGERFLLVSESSEKRDSTSADCILYDYGRITRLLLPNVSRLSHSVTDSIGSISLYDGLGFFPASGSVLMASDKRGVFKVSLVEVES